jgi:hypothetical protein
MGRHATKSARTTLALDPEIKRLVAIYALTTGRTITEIINQALKEYLETKKVKVG